MRKLRTEKMKLRKNARYFVVDGDDRFAKLIPLTYRYAGRHLCEAQGKLMHLFLAEGNEESGLYVADDLQGVEPFSAARLREIEAAATYYNETNRVPSDRTMRRLDKRARAAGA